MERIPTRIIAMGQSPKVDDTHFVPLTFTAEQANSTVQLTKVGSPADVYLDVSYDEGVTWSAYTVGNTITLASVGDKVCFAASSGVTNTTFASSTSAYHKFVMTGKIAASGDISSIRKNSKTAKNLTMANYCYCYIFRDCTALTTAPELPAMTLASRCYQYMFYNCRSLTTAPELPATGLATYCYIYMFNGCTALTTAPELPATTLTNNCYDSMFYGCTSLTTAPALPATTLSTYCYRSMFNGCTALTTAPELPATTLKPSCYTNMFFGCTSLTTAPELPATGLASSCYYYMFRGCTSLTTAPALPATTLKNYCYQQMFNGCTNLNWVEVGFTSWTGVKSPTDSWLTNVSSSGTFRCPVALGDNSTITRGVSNCPTNWTVVNI